MNVKRPTFVLQQEVEILLSGIDGMLTGSYVDVDGVGQRRVKVSTTSVAAADPQRPRRSLSLRHHRILHASQSADVGAVGRLRRGEVNQGEVDALTAPDGDPPRARRRRRGRNRKTEVGRRRR